MDNCSVSFKGMLNLFDLKLWSMLNQANSITFHFSDFRAIFGFVNVKFGEILFLLNSQLYSIADKF